MSAVLLLCLLLQLRSALGSLSAPVNLSVSSRNFHHVLRWEPGAGSPPGVKFQVYQGLDGRKQKSAGKPTNSTWYVLKLDVRWVHRYELAVRARYNHTRSPPSKIITFDPLSSTWIGPPLLSVAGCGTCILGNISLPDAERNLKLSGQDFQSLYAPSFRVVWRKEKDGRTQDLETSNKSFNLSLLEKNVEYCVQVHIQIRVNKKTLPSEWSCAFTSLPLPSDGMLVLAVVSALLILFLIVLTAGLSCLYYTGFLCKLKKTPAALMVTLWPVYVQTLSTTDLDQVTIIPQTVKHRNAPTTSRRRLDEDSEEEEEEEEEEEGGAGNLLYMDRNAELSSDGGSHQNSADSSGNIGEAARDGGGFLEKRWAEADQHESEEEPVRLSFRQDGDRSRLQVGSAPPEEEEEVKMETLDFSGDVNLFSVTLASMAACDEGEVEEGLDSESSFLRIYTLKPPSQTDSQRESDAGRSAAPKENSSGSECDEEEEDEGEISGYLTNR